MQISECLAEFLRESGGTVDIIDKAPPADDDFITTVGAAISGEKELLSSFELSDDMRFALDLGYDNAVKGYLYSAEVSIRFLLERASLVALSRATTSLYLKALAERKWHRMVDDGYIVRSGQEAIGRMRKYAGSDEVRGDAIFLAGKPVCEKHLRWPEFSKPICELPLREKYLKASRKKRKGKSVIRCAFCNREAKYFTLPMPKASALVYLACAALGVDPEGPLELYSNISRVLHPYGFTGLCRRRAFSAWARDVLTAIYYVNLLLLRDGFNPPRGDPPALAALEYLTRDGNGFVLQP